MKKALFIDRDGIVNKDTGYVYKISDIEFLDGIFDLCKHAERLGYLIIVITNQSGIARGYFTSKDVDILHSWIKSQFKKKGITITDFFICPYHPSVKNREFFDFRSSRKPEAGMILAAKQKYNIDLTQSLMVGDKDSDRIKHSDLRSIIVKSRYVTHNYDVENISKVSLILD